MSTRRIAHLAAVLAVLGLGFGRAEARGSRTHSMKKVAAQRAKHQAQLRHFEKAHHARAAVEAMRPVPIAAAPKAPIAVTPTSPSTPAVQRTAQPLSLAQRLGGSRPQLNMVSSIKHRFLRTIGTTASAPHFGFRASELPAVGSGAEAAPRLFAFAHL